MGFHVTVKENQERTYLGTNRFHKKEVKCVIVSSHPI